MLVQASLPLHLIAKALVYAMEPTLLVLLLLVAAFDLFWGGRNSVMGLVAFHTLPSREAACIWQALSIALGALAVFVMTIGIWFADSGGLNLSPWVLAGLLMGIEGLRCLACLLLTRTYASENLSTW